jgi:glutathione S-transferase
MQAYRLGVAAWAKSKELQLNTKGKMSDVAQEVIGAFRGVLAASLSDKNLRPNIPIASVAVWDTVGSMGIPTYVKGARADVFRFVDTALSRTIARGIHAMAVDELRIDFPVTKWDVRDGITQMWFVGAHADVGGGYPPSESRISDTALEWMMPNLSELGVKFMGSLVCTPDCATANTQPIHTPWTTPPFDHLGRAPRNPLATEAFHPSVRQRWDADATYRPVALKNIWP